MSAEPLSIIIVSWNTSALLRDCLESLLAQTSALGRRCEIVVVDNNSADDSAAMVASRFPGVVLIENADNRGFGPAANQGLAAASGGLYLLLNPDTRMEGDVLAASLAYLEAEPEIAVLGCRVRNMDGSVQPTCFRYPDLRNLFLLASGLSMLPWPRFCGRYRMKHWRRDEPRDVDVVTGCFMLVRASAVAEVGLLDEDFFFLGEETDWCRRFRDAGWRVSFAPIDSVYHVGNASGKRLGYQRDLYLAHSLIHYNRKHGGFLAAVVAWYLMLLYYVLRRITWGLARRFGREPSQPEIERVYQEVIQHFTEVWPHRRGGDGA